MSVIHTGNGPRQFVASGLTGADIPFTEIPVIDFGPMLEGDVDARRAVGAAVRDACTRVGFFYAKNHGVTDAALEGTFEAAKRFFALPMETKQAIHISKSRHHRGYVPLLEENTDPTARGDLHEAFDMALEVSTDDADYKAGVFGYGPNQWPEGLPGFHEAMDRYYGEVRAFGERIFRAFALALEIDENFFAPLITKPTAQLRVLHYPSQHGPVDDRQIGIGAHSDYECFTILAQQQGIQALQVLNSAGQWINATPIPGTFVVNVGDMMARWTNNYFASTVHRAINRSGKERYSIPFFFGPNSQTVIEVFETCQGPERPAQYPPITAGDYINSRFNDTFAYLKKPAGDEAASTH